MSRCSTKRRRPRLRHSHTVAPIPHCTNPSDLPLLPSSTQPRTQAIQARHTAPALAPSPHFLLRPAARPRIFRTSRQRQGQSTAMDQQAQKRVSKACDACKRRKVRCNGQTRCQQCAHLGLRCIYSPSSKQRSQGRRGHIISEFRNQTSKSPTTSPPILAARPGQGSSEPPFSPISPMAVRDGGEPSTSP